MTRIRSADSTRTRSAGFSKVMVISGGSLSPRSSFRERSSDRPMNASTDPDETVTRGDVTLMGFPAFFIFALPEIADRPADRAVDVCEAVLDHIPIVVLPDFFRQQCSTPRPLQVD